MADEAFPNVEGLTIDAVIGRGGFATVYRATQAKFDRVVALKVIGPHAHTDPDVVRRFERESRAIGALTGHPSVVTVFDSGTTTGGDPYLVMEYLPGGSLLDRAAAGTPMPWKQVLDVGIAVADALAAAHQLGIVHRDVKPANVLVDAYGRFKLSDFGVAGLASQETTAGGMNAMTVAYAAPEVLMGQRAAPASDLYSLGATLYALLTGVPAFSGETDESVVPMIYRVTTAPLVPLPVLSAPDPLRRLIESLMARDPAGRPASAQAVSEELRTIASMGWGTSTNPGSTAAGTPPPPPRVLPVFPVGPPPGSDAPTIWSSPPVPAGSVPGGPSYATDPQGTVPGQGGAGSFTIPPPLDADAAAKARARRRSVWAAIAAVVVLVVGGAALAAQGGGGTPKATKTGADSSAKRAVLDYIGRDVADARRGLEGRGFKVDVQYEWSDEADGTVLRCDPAPGTMARKGSTVVLHVSEGPDPASYKPTGTTTPYYPTDTTPYYPTDTTPYYPTDSTPYYPTDTKPSGGP